MVANSKHTDRIFNLIDRFLITSGAVGFWRNPNSFIPLIDEYFSIEHIPFTRSATKINYNTGVITYAWAEKKGLKPIPFILNIPYKEGDVI